MYEIQNNDFAYIPATIATPVYSTTVRQHVSIINAMYLAIMVMQTDTRFGEYIFVSRVRKSGVGWYECVGQQHHVNGKYYHVLC